jgi:hypothetical protein
MPGRMTTRYHRPLERGFLQRDATEGTAHDFAVASGRRPRRGALWAGMRIHPAFLAFIEE